MALIVYHKPTPAAAREPRQDRPETARKARQQPRKNEITYIFRNSSSGPRILERGHHASPAGVFTVRGHYRHYMICPCIQHIEAYEFEKAYDLYKTFTLRLKEKYLCT